MFVTITLLPMKFDPSFQTIILGIRLPHTQPPVI